jgi:hypothetical protein
MKPLQNHDQTEQYPRGNSQLRCFIEHGYTARESVAESVSTSVIWLMPDSQPRAESSPLNFLDSFEGIGMTEILRREDSAVGDSNKSKQRSEKAYPAPRPVTPSERWIGDRYFSPITPSEHWIENPYPSPVIPFELFREKRGIEEDRDVKFKEARIPKRLLKYKADVENGLTLRDVLCQRTTPQCVSEAPMTMEQLKEAARLRQRDRERAIMVLEGMDSDSFTGEDAWISEFLNTEGNSVTQLAQLLVDAKYDSPFILRPGYFQRIFSRFESVEPDNSQHITRFLPKKLFSKRFGKGNRCGEVRSPLSINEAREALTPWSEPDSIILFDMSPGWRISRGILS